MKANEFVKKHGWDYAKERLDYCKNARLVGMEIDLKRLVESHDLVESYGGLERSRKYLNEKCVFEWTALDGKLSQAICNVESCQ